MGFGSGAFGSAAFGSGTGETVLVFDVSSVEYLAADLIKVTFSESVVVNNAYKLVGNYTAVNDAGSWPVQQVIVPYNTDVLDYVLLQISPQEVEVTYTITVANLTGRSGSSLEGTSASWTYHRTKIDSLLASMPTMYDKRPTANIRGLLTAIALGDNGVGGSPSGE